MKKILAVLLGMMLSAIVSAQWGFYFNKISVDEVSETELSFVADNKQYVLTYEPNKGEITDVNRVVNHKNLYLYRKDSDGWKQASDLIRTDSCFRNEKVKQIIPESINRNDGQPIFAVEDRGFGSVYKAANGAVYITFATDIWTHKEHYVYCSILVFIPNGDETYRFSYFEPKNKEYKFIKGFQARKIVLEKNGYTPVLTNGKETFVYKTTDIGIPVLYGVYKTEYLESPDGLTIKYWDALKSNPEYWDGSESKPYVAGTLNFKITNGSVVYEEANSTISLFHVKR
jgi:hypothetical protein